jgi:outer membrane translocation and assembly module TamA
LRGFFSERFAGDASLVGGAELRTKLFDMSLLLPETIYMFLFAESGKVFLKGEDSKLWHTGYGGGLAISIVNRDATFSLSFARSKERKVAIYFNTGFVF